MSEETIRAGVVGVGHLGRHHARIYAELPGVELVGIVDQDAARAEEIASQHRTRVFPDVASLAAEVQAVSVAVPTQHHRDVALPLLAAGCDTLIEKPIAKAMDEADEIVAAAERYGRIVMVGHTERFNPAVKSLAERVKQPRFFEVHRLAAFSARSTDIDVVLDLMIHDLDLLLAMDGGDVVQVDAVGIAALTDKVDIANARLRFASGCVANLTASRISAEPLRRLRVFQSRTYLSCDTGKRSVEGFRLTADPSGKPKIVHERVDVPDEEPLGNELTAFVDAVRTRNVPSIDARQGRKVLQLAHRVLDAIATAAEPTG